MNAALIARNKAARVPLSLAASLVAVSLSWLPARAEPAPSGEAGKAPANAPDAPAAAPEAMIELPDAEVVGRRKDPDRNVSATAFKLPMRLHEIPRSLTVMDAERLRDQNFANLAGTLNYVPGMSMNSNANEGYHYYARGQRMAAADTRLDGFAGLPAGGDFSPNLYGIDQVVMMRGPAGLLYGASGAPGGLINMISKKPRETAARRADFRVGPFGGSSVGNNAGYGVDLDLTGPLTDDGRVLYRGLATLENVNQYTANIEDKNRFAALTLTYKLDNQGRYKVSPLAQFTSLAKPAGRGAFISPASSRTTNDGSSALDFRDISSMNVNLSAGGRTDDQFLAGFDFNAAPADAIRIYAGYRYLNYDTHVNQFAPNVATLVQAKAGDGRSWTVQRRQTTSVTERWNHSFDVNGSYDFKPDGTSWWKNLTQAGVNGRWNGNDRSATATGPNQSAINIYNGAAPAIRDSALTLTEAFLARNFAFNAYLQDQVSLGNGRWVATLGLGYAQETPDRDYGPTAIDPDTVKGLADITSTRYGEPTPNAALLFNATKALALYGSYATSYTLAPGEREDVNGNAGGFKPEQGVGYELGLKYDLPADYGSLSLALFHAERYAVMVQSAATDLNGNGNRYYAQRDGEGILARGVELGIEARPIRNWRLSAGGAYIRARNQSQSDPVADGAPADKTPEWSANLFTRYDLAQGPLDGLGASIGAIYQGERVSAVRTAAAPDPLVLPWFGRLDLGLYYRVNGNVDFALNVENLNDDRRIAVDGTTGTGIELSAPRRISFRTGYRM
jgi:iron complex outermembrane receptor protein